MTIKQITVTAGRTFNHPFEQYSNFRCDAHLDAEIGEGEDAGAAVKALQAQVEGIVEDHKQNLLKSVKELELMRRETAEMQGLKATLSQAQARLEEIRARHPGLEQLGVRDAGEVPWAGGVESLGTLATGEEG